MERLQVAVDRSLDAGQREAALQAMSRDKKARKGSVRFVVLDGLGAPRVAEVSPADCARALAEALA